MSTTKNEQYHILSPEWLTRNKVPDDAQYRPFEFPDGSWLPSRYTGCVLTPEEVIDSQYRTQRTDLPPEAYATPPQKNEHNPGDDGPEEMDNIAHIDTKFVCRRITPPTDTTGSGREGETPEYCPICTYPTKETPGDSVCRCKGIQTWALSCYPGEVAFVKMHPNNSAPSFYRRDDADKRIDQLERQRDAALAQVEALRRDGELLDHLDSSLNQLAIFGNFVMGGEKQSARAAIRRHVEHCKRAAIDSAQRQEGE